MLNLVFFSIMIAFGYYVRSVLREPAVPPELTEDQIRQKWRQLGFFCELDDERRLWALTGSRAGLLYFPDLLLGYAADPENASDGKNRHYGPYGSLKIMTWREPGLDGQAIRGSASELERLAELVEAKLATAQPGEPIRIHDEFNPKSVYSLLLDIRADGYDPAVPDRERLGATKRRVEKRESPGVAATV